MTELVEPRMWSDFDRTAARMSSKVSLRSLIQNPFPIRAGYLDFLLAAQAGGVEFAGIVTRRPNTWLATVRSVGRLGLDEHFPGTHQVVFAGSEAKKARVVAADSENHVVGMIDDHPRRFGEALFREMYRNPVYQDGEGRREVVLGAVHYPNCQRYIGELAERAAMVQDVELHVNSDEILIAGVDFDLHVVPLQPYSAAAGEEFAAILTELNSARQLAA